MRDSASHALWQRVVEWSSERGMNLAGAVGAVAFDETQPRGRRAQERLPGCETIVVLATGGRSGWAAACAANGGSLGPPRPDYHPIDEWGRSVAQGLARDLERLGFASRVETPDDTEPLNFRQLAEMAGLGTISPVIGHLLHPDYGPWVSLRAALLVSGRPFGAVGVAPERFEPCLTCHRPCLDACPAGAYDDGLDSVRRCAEHRLLGGCATGCEVLRACPLGKEHRYAADEERFRHAYSLFAIRRSLGGGLWQQLLRVFRRG